MQAAIAACHAVARRPEDTDWGAIVALYDGLAEISRSPVVDLNRAVAISMAYGPEAALELVEGLTSNHFLQSYYLLPAVRGDLFARLGRLDDARAEFLRAASMTENRREREVLEARARGVVDG